MYSVLQNKSTWRATWNGLVKSFFYCNIGQLVRYIASRQWNTGSSVQCSRSQRSTSSSKLNIRRCFVFCTAWCVVTWFSSKYGRLSYGHWRLMAVVLVFSDCLLNSVFVPLSLSKRVTCVKQHGWEMSALLNDIVRFPFPPATHHQLHNMVWFKLIMFLNNHSDWFDNLVHRTLSHSVIIELVLSTRCGCLKGA